MKLLTDRPFTAIKQLTAGLIQTTRLFDKQGGEVSNNPFANMLSQNGTYFAKQLELRFRRFDGAPLVAGDLAFLGQFLRNSFVSLQVNRSDTWSALLAGLSLSPLNIGAQNYNSDATQVVRYRFNVPDGIKFPKNVEFNLSVAQQYTVDPSAYCLVSTFLGIEELEEIQQAG